MKLIKIPSKIRKSVIYFTKVLKQHPYKHPMRVVY